MPHRHRFSVCLSVCLGCRKKAELTIYFKNKWPKKLIFRKDLNLEYFKNGQKCQYWPKIPKSSPPPSSRSHKMFWNDNITSISTSYLFQLIHKKHSDLLIYQFQPKYNFFGEIAQNAILPPRSPQRSPQAVKCHEMIISHQYLHLVSMFWEKNQDFIFSWKMTKGLSWGGVVQTGEYREPWFWYNI